MEHATLAELVKNKNVLFITTKNIDYIRNVQELNLVRNKSCNLEIICSRSKSYLFRIVSVYFQIILQYIKRLLNIGKIASADVIMVGFAPQLVLPFTRWMMGKKTIIIVFFISVYDTMVNDRKKLSPMSPLTRFCHYIDRVSLSHADHIIADTIQHAKYFVDEFHAPSSSIETIYIEADSNIFGERIAYEQDIEVGELFV